MTRRAALHAIGVALSTAQVARAPCPASAPAKAMPREVARPDAVRARPEAPRRTVGATYLIGGSADSPEHFAALRALAIAAHPLLERPRVAVFRSSSTAPEEARLKFTEDGVDVNGKCTKSFAREFLDAGLEPILIPIGTDNYRSAAYDQKIIDLLKSCHCVYLCGGEQARHARCLLTDDGNDTPLMAALRRLHAAGATIAGSSAGMHVQVKKMYGGGSVKGYLIDNDVQRASIADAVTTSKPALSPGFDLVQTTYPLLTCTHFDARFRLARLLIALREADRDRGIAPNRVSDRRTVGVAADEDTGLMIVGDVGTVIGKRGIFIVDNSGAKFGEGRHFSCENVCIHYLTSGDSYNFKEKRVISSKQPLESKRKDITQPSIEQILMPYEFSRLISELAESNAKGAVALARTMPTIGEIFRDGDLERITEDLLAIARVYADGKTMPSFTFRLRQDANTRVFKTGDKRTVSGLRLSVTPVAPTRLRRSPLGF